VTCSGEEQSLADCQHANWGDENCDHKEDVGCICEASFAAGTTPGAAWLNTNTESVNESQSGHAMRSTLPPDTSHSGIISRHQSFPSNFYVIMEFCGIWYWPTISGQIRHIFRDHSFPRNAEFWAEPRNLPISAEFLCFHGILWNSVLDGDKGTNMTYFGGVQAAVLYVYMISPWNTWLPLGLWQEEYWKYWAELMSNIAG